MRISSSSVARAAVEQYHDGTKHHFHRFARSLGYLDWASQPHPFRAFIGAPIFPLYPAPSAVIEDYVPRSVACTELFETQRGPEPLTAAAIGDLFRHALGLSAWKQFGTSRWSLRVNPSSGNLHPTEAYLVAPRLRGLAATPGVYHYAADRHVLELRCAFDERAWAASCDGQTDTLLVALTSIHWREAWKYGERAFRYCQHDLGHAIAAIDFAAALLGWRVRLLPAWSYRSIASLTGLDRDEDFVDAEREEPGCMMAIESGARDAHKSGVGADLQVGPLVEALRRGRWAGRASQLSEDHVQWTFIDDVARATEDEGRPEPRTSVAQIGTGRPSRSALLRRVVDQSGQPDARSIILQRRSALALDGRSAIERSAFFEILSTVMPGTAETWNALWWTPRIHFALFVHRVHDLAPGLYALARDPHVIERLKNACMREFSWEHAHEELPFFQLALGDSRALAARVSCDQDIAADGFFSLGMIADFSASLDAYGASFYRNLYWESGAAGQALYLAAEAAGARSTGIGCFYDDAVHDVLGLQGHAFQSLYHFTVGMPLEDTRLTTQPGYGWEVRP